ncbi:MAG: hypothetical protein ACKO7P_08015 [Bacteroidota bacterium]
MSVFPQYRKLINNKSYYRIEDENHFTEIQLIGKKAFELKIQAVQFPEKLKIKDMLNCEEPYIRIEQSEFDRVYNSLIE